MNFVESKTGVKTYSISVSSSLHLQVFTDYTFYLQFIMTVPTMDEEGLYNLYFHACPNYKEPLFLLNFDVSCAAWCFLYCTITNFLLYRSILKKETEVTICRLVKCHCQRYTS